MKTNPENVKQMSISTIRESKKAILKQKNELLAILNEKALRYGKVTLSSGKESDYYVDAKLATLDPRGLYLTSNLFFDLLSEDNFDAIGGLTIGADPIVAALARLIGERKEHKEIFIVRRKPKKHGMQKNIEGSLKPNSKVVIVDDVATTGDSILQTIKVVEKYNCEIVKVLVLVDRLEGAAEKLQNQGYKFDSIFTKKDLLST